MKTIYGHEVKDLSSARIVSYAEATRLQQEVVAKRIREQKDYKSVKRVDTCYGIEVYKYEGVYFAYYDNKRRWESFNLYDMRLQIKQTLNEMGVDNG